MEALPRQGELSGASPAGAWQIDRLVGGAAELHALEASEGVTRRATWCSVDRPALVLGSAQPLGTIDVERCEAAGIEIVRRRSGGGAVLMLPGRMLWLDVVIGRDDPLWSDDVGRSMWWIGEVWAGALTSLGIDGVGVHRGPLVSTPWSRVVCYDSIGSGEVLVGSAKAVGISQRRTRSWARLQTSVHVRWDGALMCSLLAPPRPAAADLRPVWSTSGATGEVTDEVTGQVTTERLRSTVEAALQTV